MATFQVSWMVIDSATSLGVTGLTASGDFTTFKLCEDGVNGSDIKGTITIQDHGAGQYGASVTSSAVKELKVVPVMAVGTYQAYPVVIRVKFDLMVQAV